MEFQKENGKNNGKRKLSFSFKFPQFHSFLSAIVRKLTVFQVKMKFCGRKKEKREHFILFYLFHHLDFYFHLNFLSFFCFFTRKSEKDGNSKGKKKDFFQLIFCQISFFKRSIVKILMVVVKRMRAEYPRVIDKYNLNNATKN